MLSFAAVAAASCLGCGAACDTSDEANPPDRYVAGTTTDGTYESSPWKSGFLPYPGAKQYQLVHHLGFTPAQVEIFLAFSGDGERVAPCAGNSCLVRCVDDELIWLKNDTCAEFFIRVVATGKSSESRGRACTDGGALDAGTPIDAANENATEDAAADGPTADVGATSSD